MGAIANREDGGMGNRPQIRADHYAILSIDFESALSGDRGRAHAGRPNADVVREAASGRRDRLVCCDLADALTIDECYAQSRQIAPEHCLNLLAGEISG